MRIALFAPAIFLLGFGPTPTGETWYRDGFPGAFATTLAGEHMPAPACADCHRRSRAGDVEGNNRFPPLTSRALSAARAGLKPRPAYTDATLSRAITQGIDSGGRALDPLMPRYKINADTQEKLIAYLNSAPAPVPGLSQEEIRFATIIDDEVSASRRDALLTVLRTFFAERNRDPRNERARRGHVPGEKWPTFRRWTLDVWHVSGPAHTWRAQLDQHYRSRPVFALLSGIGGQWQPVHEFCEENAVPCLFPQTAWPGKESYYSIYFSAGARLDAKIIATYLRASSTGSRVVQVYSEDTIEAANTFATAWAQPVRSLALPKTGDRMWWREMLAHEKPDALVLWLDQRDWPEQEWLSLWPTQVLVSETLADVARDDMSGLRNDVYFPFPYLQPRAFSRQEPWLAARGLTGELRTAAMALFACATAADAFGHARDEISRDLFIERIEHMLDAAQLPTLFTRAGLAPGQRYLLKGAAIARYRAGTLQLVDTWINP